MRAQFLMLSFLAHACTNRSALEEQTLAHSLHIWMTASAVRDDSQIDAEHAARVLMFVCLVREGDRTVQK